MESKERPAMFFIPVCGKFHYYSLKNGSGQRFLKNVNLRTVLKTGKTHSVDFEENEDGLQIATYEVSTVIALF